MAAVPKLIMSSFLYTASLSSKPKNIKAGLDLCVAQRAHEINPNDENFNKLENRQTSFGDVYDSFYGDIKRCIPKYT